MHQKLDVILVHYHSTWKEFGIELKEPRTKIRTELEFKISAAQDITSFHTQITRTNI